MANLFEKIVDKVLDEVLDSLINSNDKSDMEKCLAKMDELIANSELQNLILIEAFDIVIEIMEEANSLLMDLVSAVNNLPNAIIDAAEKQRIKNDVQWMKSKLTQAKFLGNGSTAEIESFVDSIISGNNLKDRLIRINNYQNEHIIGIPDSSFYLPGKKIANKSMASSREIKKVAICLFSFTELVSKKLPNPEDYTNLALSGLELIGGLQREIKENERKKFKAFGGGLNQYFGINRRSHNSPNTKIYTRYTGKRETLKADSTDGRPTFQSESAVVILDDVYYFNDSIWTFDVVEDDYFHMRNMNFKECDPLITLNGNLCLRKNSDQNRIVTVNLLRDPANGPLPKDIQKAIIVDDKDRVLSLKNDKLVFDGDFKKELPQGYVSGVFSS